MRRLHEFFGRNGGNPQWSFSDITNSAWMLGEKFLQLVIGIFVGFYVARFLGPEAFGVLAYTQSIVAILLSIAAFGLNPIVIRSLVTSSGPVAAILGGAVTVNILGCTIAGAGYVAALAFAGFTDLEAKVFAVSGLAVFFSLQSPVEAALMARLQYRLAAGAIMAASLVAATLRVLFVYLGAPLVAFAYAYLAEQAMITVAVFFAFLSTEGWRLRLRASWPETRRTFAAALPNLLATTFTLLYMRIDQIMIRHLMDVDAVGIYTAAVRISEVWYFIPTILTVSLFPAILKARQQSEAAFEQRMMGLFDIMAVLSWAVIAATAVFGRTAILILYGVEFADAASVLKILVLGGLFVAVGAASNRWYLSSGGEWRLLYRVLGGLLVNVGLNFLLIPRFGLAGAAWATVTGYAFGYWLFDLIDPETRILFRCKTRAMLLAPAGLSILRARRG